MNIMTELFNIRLKLLYKETEKKYENDDEVDQDDMFFLCDEMYRHELLLAFCLKPNEVDLLGHRVEKLYDIIKKEPEIEKIIKDNQFFQDDFTTFMTLFSYEHFYLIYPIIVSLIDKE
jgi:hypothetical protein